MKVIEEFKKMLKIAEFYSLSIYDIIAKVMQISRAIA
jgi:hypothetical protein